jgi:hypothetical protein
VKKSSKESCKRSEALLQECFAAIPGLMLANRSVTTSSIYCKTPDGRSLRIGDHKGREKYSYKWKDQKKNENRYIWRYYTSSVEDLAGKIGANVAECSKPRHANDELPY